MEIIEMNVFDHNKEVIITHVLINPEDMPVVDESVNKLIEAGVGKIKDFTFVESESWGCWEIILTDYDENIYYLILSNYGTIELLCKESLDGEVLLHTMYDNPAGFDISGDWS